MQEGAWLLLVGADPEERGWAASKFGVLPGAMGLMRD
jgi:hypothetical protein